jgi:UMP-CMP kinase
LRAEQLREGGQYSEAINNFMREGELVPTKIVVELLHDAIQESVRNERRRVLIDGFPRKLDQARAFESAV